MLTWNAVGMADAPKLKDFFTEDLVREIGKRVRSVHPSFDLEPFVAAAVAGDWEEASLTGRSRRIADALWDALGRDVDTALEVVVAVLPEELDDPEGALNEGFWMWPLSDLIAARAVDYPGEALDACEALTKRFTAEFAIRPFLIRYPETLDRVDRWARDPNEHLRRLASEGTRPRLPWAQRLDLPVDRTLAVLSQLRKDESPYVRRSVANHLNDLAKDHGDRIVGLLEEWHGEGVEETTWIVRHAMRNHLKNGDPRVMALFGYEPADVEVAELLVTPAEVSIGNSVEITFDLRERAGRDQKLMVDLVVGYVKANGTTSPKVFKFKDFELPAGKTERCRRKLDMVVLSTRKLYPGTHSITVRVNGADLARNVFELGVADS
jgi:3-methyladenine DNA glycosylase AlkC